MKIILTRNLISLFLGLLLTTACKTKEPVLPEPIVPKGTFKLHLHTYLDNNEVDLYNIDYTMQDGRKIALTMAQLYLSDLQLVKSEGSIVNVLGKKILKVLENDTYLVGDVPIGDYNSIRFKVGLDPTANLLNPKTASDSAILNKPEMWFQAAAQPDGYIFMNVQGKIDTSANLNKPMVPFCYKIGTNAHYVQVNMASKNFTVEEAKTVYGHVLIDYNKLFNGIPLNVNANLSVKTVAENQSAIAAKIANNISTMFNYE